MFTENLINSIGGGSLRFVSPWHGRPRLNVKVLILNKIVTLCNLIRVL